MKVLYLSVLLSLIAPSSLLAHDQKLHDSPILEPNPVRLPVEEGSSFLIIAAAVGFLLLLAALTYHFTSRQNQQLEEFNKASDNDQGPDLKVSEPEGA